MTDLMPFHLAIPVKELGETPEFYKNVLKCKQGRRSEKWMDLDFFGHQLVLHIAQDRKSENIESVNSVDGHDVPIPHFGVVLNYDDWHEKEKNLKEYGMKFLIEPYIRFKGEPGEQATMFFYDPSGNAVELKAFKDLGQLFVS
ncbi:MAG: VOC family protein [Ignavibacteria bacterium]